MRTRRKHDATDEALRVLNRVTETETKLAAHLRTYKQQDLLLDICSARETAAHLHALTGELTSQISALADAELVSRALRRSA